jgi:hypothetical protein
MFIWLHPRVVGVNYQKSTSTLSDLDSERRSWWRRSAAQAKAWRDIGYAASDPYANLLVFLPRAPAYRPP